MNKVLASLLLALMTAPLRAQIPADVPQLVVGITVDQLRTDYIMALQHLFGEKGFKRLMKEGLVYENVTFGFPNVDCSSALSVIYTGTYPFYNGIPSDKVYNLSLRREEFALNDPEKIGNYTDETYSPKNLKTSTLSDEIKIVGNGLGRVFSVAPSAQHAIISAGHAANSAFWLNEKNGKWATTTYYLDVPIYVEQRNYNQSLSLRIDTLAWVPLLSPEKYTALPYLRKDFPFKHIFPKNRYDKYAQFKTTALVNTEVTAVAKDFLDKGLLGRRGYLDMLNVGYTAGTYQNKTIQLYSLEIQDMYVRLDKEIADLLDYIDRTVGLKRTVIFLASTGYFRGEGKESSQYNIPDGEFYPKRAVSLLNMYLMALYGQGDLVAGYHNRQIYLNHKLVKEKDLKLDEIQSQAAEFLIQMAGVQDVFTSRRLLLGNSNEHIDALRRGYYPKLSGDILLELNPGWEVVYEDVHDTREYVRGNAIPSPLFILSEKIKPQHITRPIKATEIAPTVARLLRIRSPNGSTESPLPEVE